MGKIRARRSLERNIENYWCVAVQAKALIHSGGHTKYSLIVSPFEVYFFQQKSLIIPNLCVGLCGDVLNVNSNKMNIRNKINDIFGIQTDSLFLCLRQKCSLIN